MLINRGVDQEDAVYIIYAMGYYSATEKNKTLLLAAT